jgi:hypothetical protein
MPSAAYFRRQADICLRLSLIASDEEVSSRLIAMARGYTSSAEALAGEGEGGTAGSADLAASPDGVLAEATPAGS